MSLHRRAAKRDAAEPEIVKTLEALGCVVWRVSGKGLPDLVVFCPKSRAPDGFRRRTFVADVKGPKEKATPAQVEKWTALVNLGFSVFILRTPEDAVAMLNNALQSWEPTPRLMRDTMTPEQAKALLRKATHGAPRKGDAAKALPARCSKGGCRKRLPCADHTHHLMENYSPPRSKPVDAAKEAEETFAPAAIPPCPDCGEAYESKCYDRTAPVGAVSCTKYVHCVRYEGHDGDCQTLGPRCCTT